MERKLKSRLCKTSIQNTISNATFIFIFYKRTPIDISAQNTHLEISLTDLLDSIWNVFLSRKYEEVNFMHSRFGKCIGIKMTVYSVLFAIFSGLLNHKLLYSEEKWCASYAFLGFIRLSSLMIWICHCETLSWLAWSKRSQIHHWTPHCGPTVNRPTDTIWSYANLRTADFNSTRYL